MSVAFSADISPLLHKLESIFELDAGEKAAVAGLPLQVAQLRPDQDIVRERDQPSRSAVLLEGFTCSYKLNQDGGRQIVSFGVPGDTPDLQSLLLKVMDNSLGTISACKVAFVEHEDLRRLCERYPRIAAAFWRETLIEGSICRERMNSIGRRESPSRIAHLFCEMVVRLEVVGLADRKGGRLPLTQQDIADALGITSVHVNRTLRDLKKEGLVELERGVLRIPNWEALVQIGEFDPTYLHLEPLRRSAI